MWLMRVADVCVCVHCVHVQVQGASGNGFVLNSTFFANDAQVSFVCLFGSLACVNQPGHDVSLSAWPWHAVSSRCAWPECVA